MSTSQGDLQSHGWTYRKQTGRPLNETDPEVRSTVADALLSLEAEGESNARSMALHFDNWDGEILTNRAAMAEASVLLDRELISDIALAHDHIRRFAEAQAASLQDFSMELSPGLIVGQRVVPVTTAGCYVPAGRFAHIASALMSVTTAAVAGVENIIVASPARTDRGGVHPAILHAAHLAGATHMLGLGGIQGIGSLAYGLFTGLEADIIVGPGNSFVAEAKRQLFGRVGIDVIAGPTESMIVADASADAHRVAVDLVGQAEHGPDSPVWLVTTSPQLAENVLAIIDGVAEALPTGARESATSAWRDYGEVMVAPDFETAAACCDFYAPEHLQVMADDLDWWRKRLRNYGSLFLGDHTTVTFGDKSSGPNHILPTGRAARYSGGLNVMRFMKQLTWQELTPEAGETQAPIAARISRYEGMEGHARSADLRSADLRGADVRAAAVVNESAPVDSDALPYVKVDFTEQPPIPHAGVQRANELMASGRLFRYGETGSEEADVAALERTFAEAVGAKYCVALNSCGASLAVALASVGVQRGDDVMMNAFTLAPVPGSLAHVGANPVFVEIDEDYLIDVDSLMAAHERTGSKFLMLSHMRGHIADMQRISTICEERDITLIEDCAHTMGATWDGNPTGTFGVVGCFSTQTFKHINSGEGGLLVTDDEDVAAKAILHSGSYMLFEQHGARPDAEVFDRHKMTTPNWSMRMSALAASVVLPQVALLDERAEVWRSRYDRLAAGLADASEFRVPVRPPEEGFVPSSFQFTVVDADPRHMDRFVKVAAEHGVHIKWFGRDEPVGFTSRFDHWRYANEQSLARTTAILSGLCDIRLPLGLTNQDCDNIVAVLTGAWHRVKGS